MDLSPTINCHCFRARKKARELTRRYDEKLRPKGLRSTQFTILAVLALKGPLPVNELADIVGLERTTVSRSIARMEDKGWIDDAPTDDARVHLLRLTSEGRKMVEDAYPAWKEVQDAIDEELLVTSH